MQTTSDMNNPAPTLDEVIRVATVPERSLLRVLATAQQHELDVADLVANLASEFEGKTARELRQLAGLMSRGVPVLEAICQTPGVLDSYTVIALQLASAEGRLLPMYRTLLATKANESRELKTDETRDEAVLMQSTTGIFFALIILTFLMLFVMPTFETMFDEFGLMLPATTLLLLAIRSYVPLVLLGVLAMIALYYICNMSALTASLKNRYNPMAWRKQLVPPKIKLLSLLAISAQCQRSFGAGIVTLAESYPAGKIRHRLQNTVVKMQRGDDVFAALATERLLTKRESAALSLTKSNSAQAWLLRWFASRRLNRHLWWAPLFVKSLATFTTLFLGFIVIWAALAVMIPLFELIHGLTR